MEVHELADQVLYRIQKQCVGSYGYVCLLQGNVCFKDAFYKKLTLPPDKMLFPFVHRDTSVTPSLRTRKNNPMVSTAFVSIPSTIVTELSHFPLTPNALDYAPHPPHVPVRRRGACEASGCGGGAEWFVWDDWVMGTIHSTLFSAWAYRPPTPAYKKEIIYKTLVSSSSSGFTASTMTTVLPMLCRRWMDVVVLINSQELKRVCRGLIP